MANSHGKVAAAAIVAQLSGWPVNPDADAHQHLLQLRRRQEGDARGERARVRRGREDVQDGGGLRRRERRPDELEGVYAWNWAQNIWADSWLRPLKSRRSPGGASQWPDDRCGATPLAAAAGCRFRFGRGAAGESATAGAARARCRATCGRARRRWPSRRCASSGRAEALRRLLARRAPPPAADALLCTALALCWRDDDAPYEPSRWWTRRSRRPSATRGTRAQASFINACLRRFLRERDALVAATDARPGRALEPSRAGGSSACSSDQPQHWQAILAANNSQRADDAARQPRRDARAHYAARHWPSAGIAADAGGRARRDAGPAAAGARDARLRRGRGVGAGRGRPAGRAAAAGRPAAGERPAAHPGRLRRARRQDRAPAGAGRCRGDWRWTSIRRAASASTRPCGGSGLQAQVLAADAAPSRQHGGTASRSTPSCWTRPAPPRASCAATPTCAGCAARATSRSWPRSRPGCWLRCGRC